MSESGNINITQDVELNKDEIYQEALSTWGSNMQIDMCIEEMSELTKALIKFKRGKGHIANIAEEIADVSIMLEQMVHIFDCHNQTVGFKQFKLARLKNTLIAVKKGGLKQ